MCIRVDVRPVLQESWEDEEEEKKDEEKKELPPPPAKPKKKILDKIAEKEVRNILTYCRH